MSNHIDDTTCPRKNILKEWEWQCYFTKVIAETLNRVHFPFSDFKSILDPLTEIYMMSLLWIWFPIGSWLQSY